MKNHLETIKKLLEEAPVYFAPQYDFEGRKLEWLQKAQILLEALEKEPKVKIKDDLESSLQEDYPKWWAR